MKLDTPKAIIPYRYRIGNTSEAAVVAFIDQSDTEHALLYGLNEKDHIIYRGKRYDGVKGLYALYNDIERDNLAKTLEKMEEI